MTKAILQRAISIAVDVMARAGMCVNEQAECEYRNRCDSIRVSACRKCIEHWLVKKAKSELAGEMKRELKQP